VKDDFAHPATEIFLYPLTNHSFRLNYWPYGATTNEYTGQLLGGPNALWPTKT